MDSKKLKIQKCLQPSTRTNSRVPVVVNRELENVQHHRRTHELMWTLGEHKTK